MKVKKRKKKKDGNLDKKEKEIGKGSDERLAFLFLFFSFQVQFPAIFAPQNAIFGFQVQFFEALFLDVIRFSGISGL